MKIPFCMTLKGLLLSGKDREKAKIEYEKFGEEKDRLLLDLEYDSLELKKLNEYKIKKIEIDKKYNKIDDYEYEIQLSRIKNNQKPLKEQELNELEINYKFNKINEIEYYKTKNDLLEKPWVALKTKYDENDNPDNIELEVIYNKQFIKNLKKQGLPGETDDEVAAQWLNLFLISNLDSDDLMMIMNDDEVVNNKPVKINDKRLIK